MDKSESQTLSSAQRSSLERRQCAEFLKRYRFSDGEGVNVFDSMGIPRMACSLVVANERGDGGGVVGCAGVEVSSVDDSNDKRSRRIDSVPVMSNLAVGKR